MHRLELRVPPLLLLGVIAVLQWLTAWILPGLALSIPAGGVAAVALAASGVLVALAGVLAFRRARTTVNPMHPEQSARVVDSGIYRYTRNPMYLGFALILAGFTLWLGHLVAALWWPVFIAWLSRLQIRPEERILRERFGEPFEAYLLRVRRWI